MEWQSYCNTETPMKQAITSLFLPASDNYVIIKVFSRIFGTFIFFVFFLLAGDCETIGKLSK